MKHSTYIKNYHIVYFQFSLCPFVLAIQKCFHTFRLNYKNGKTKFDIGRGTGKRFMKVETWRQRVNLKLYSQEYLHHSASSGLVQVFLPFIHGQGVFDIMHQLAGETASRNNLPSVCPQVEICIIISGIEKVSRG